MTTLVSYQSKDKTYQHAWSTDRKVALILRGLRGSRSVAQLCREAGISPTCYYQWRKEFIAAARDGLADSESRSRAMKEHIQKLEAENANLRLQVRILQELCLAE